MLKKIILAFFILLLGLFLADKGSQAQESTISGHFFYGRGCPHCAKMEVFLEKMEQKYEFFKVNKYEIYFSPENAQLLQTIAQEFSIDGSGVPVLIIGDKPVIGYLNDATTGERIESLIIDYQRQKNCPDLVGNIICNNNASETNKLQEVNTRLTLPILGAIDAKSFSLPVLTMVLGLLDGFNPCAMWVLLFLISLLLGVKDRRKMWILGTTFIVASAGVYFLFMAAWLNLFLFLGFVVWVRPLIGVVALGVGGINLRAYLRNQEGGCVVVDKKKRQRWFEKMKDIIGQKSLLLAISGIIVLAFAVNLVELICSAGLPAVYTKALTLSPLSLWQYYAYLLLYVFFFMIDDLVIFVIAMLTLQAMGIQRKYARYSHLVGGILLLAIGILMIFRPAVLMFG